MRSVNKVILVGNVTWNPELKHTERNSLCACLTSQPTETGSVARGKRRKKPNIGGEVSDMRSVNKVILVGNVTWDPELKHTENNKSVCSFGLATNRNWTSGEGEKKEETDFHRIVAWGKLAEICKECLRIGRLVYVEVRLHSRSFTDNEGIQKSVIAIVIDDMQMLDKKPTSLRYAGG